MTSPRPNRPWQSISRRGILIGTDGGYQQILSVSTINFDLMSGAEQASRLRAFENFLNSLTGDLQLIVLTRPLAPADLNLAIPAPPAAGGLAADYVNLLSRLVDRHQLTRRRFLVVVGSQLTRPDLAAASVQLQASAEAVINGLAQVGLTAQVVDRAGVRAILADYWDPARPVAVEERPQSLRVGHHYSRTLVVSGWPMMAHPGWLSALINWPANLDISYHYRPVDLTLAQTKLNRKITELDSRQRQLQRKGRPPDPEAADALESAVELRQQIQRGQQKLFLVSLVVTVRAGSEPALDRLVGQLETLLGSRLFQVRPALWQQLEGFGATLPRGQNDLGGWRNLNSACAALTFPFIGSELVDTEGILYGVNPTNNSLVLVDRFGLANANSIIFAQSGAGKSYLAKVEILRQLLAGVEVVVIDPENEYQTLARAVGGQVVRFQPDQPARLNLLDRQLWASPAGTVNLADLVELLGLLVGLDSADDRLAVDRLLGQLYVDLPAGQSPVWADLVRLAREQAPGLVSRLERFGASSLGQVFSRPTNLDLDRPLTVLALDDWPAEYRPALTLLFSVWVRGLARRQPRKRLLVIDEGWLLLESPVAGRLLAGLVRRARKDYLGVCFISQQADDFLNNPAGRVIASQAALKILLRADSTAIKTLARQFRLSAVEQDFLLTAERGQALLLAGAKHAIVQIVASETEHPLITTDPGELQALKQSVATTAGQPAGLRSTTVGGDAGG